MTTSDNQLSGWTKKKLQSIYQSQMCIKKKVMVTVWWSAACLVHYSFPNPSKTITSEKYAQQINEMHQKLQCLQLALVNRKDPSLQQCTITRYTAMLQKLQHLQPASVNRKGPILHNTTQPHVTQLVFQKMNESGY